MTDFLADSPSVGRFYCPGCETTADPLTEVLDVRWCADHAPVTTGAADGEVAMGWISGGQEAGGEDNRRWCDLFHRAKIVALLALLLGGCATKVTLPPFFCAPAEYQGLKGAAGFPIEGAK